MTLPHLQTSRCIVRLVTVEDAPAVVAFLERNRSFLAQYEPQRPPEFYTDAFWQAQATCYLEEFKDGRSCRFFIFRKGAPTEQAVIGSANISGIMRLVFQACYLGYSLDEKEQGQGLMTEALTAIVDYIFAPAGLGLHRIMANHLPDNEKSARMLKRLGFEVEGYARDYLLIDGRWRDHVLNALVNKSWVRPAQ